MQAGTAVMGLQPLLLHTHAADCPAAEQVSLDNINLFSIITIMAFFLLLPVTLLQEGVRLTPSALQASGIADTSLVIRRALLAGFCFHSYQQVCLSNRMPRVHHTRICRAPPATAHNNIRAGCALSAVAFLA